jgi:hypothetical protein
MDSWKSRLSSLVTETDYAPLELQLYTIKHRLVILLYSSNSTSKSIASIINRFHRSYHPNLL